MRNALERDPGVEVNCLLYQPDIGKPGAGRGYLSAFPKDEELAKYDVVFLGDVGTAKAQASARSAAATGPTDGTAASTEVTLTPGVSPA